MKLLNLLGLGTLFLFGLQSHAQLTSTNLPIVILTTPGTISSTQLQGTMSIIDNLSGINTPTDVPKFSGMIGINLRGNATYPKSSYSIETWSAPTVSLDTALLGMPSENDWVLLSSYEDRSLLRNVLALRLHDKMGRYAPRLRHCEVILNNQYQGIYIFGEKVKRDSLRLDIAKLDVTDNSGLELTGGYIVKIDGGGAGWTSAFAPPYAGTQVIKFEYEYPGANDITPAQMDYIKSYVDSFEIALNGASFQDTTVGWRKFGAVNSFIDFMIMQEVSRNNEAYRKNTFIYKDKGTKLRPGPLWNFDVAWKNTADCLSSKDTGWCFNYGVSCGTDTKLPPFWWQKLTQDVQFMEDLKCRYQEYRQAGNVLDTTTMFMMMDSINTKLNAANAVTRNFVQWPIWGVPIVNEPTPMATNYTQELTNLKAFIKARLAWLDTKWKPAGACPFPVATSDIMLNEQIAIYPNPFKDQLHIQLNDTPLGLQSIELINLQGQQIIATKTMQSSITLHTGDLPSGIYLLKVQTASGISIKKVIKD